MRVIKCCIALGDTSTAENALSRLRELEPNNATVTEESKNLNVLKRYEEDITKTWEKKDYRRVNMFQNESTVKK